MSGHRAIVLFTRSPEAEARVKRLPVAAGARLFRAFLDSWRERAEEAGAELLVVAPAASAAVLERCLGDRGPAVQVQSGGPFGRRLADATDKGFDRAARAVLIAGGDSPPPPADLLREAFSFLEAGPSRLVVGPALDGGVNLIGLSRRAPEILASIPWGGSSVEADLLARASSAGWLFRRLPPIGDLDRLADVSAAFRVARADPRWEPYRALLGAVLLPCGLTPGVAAERLPRPPRLLSIARAPPAA